MNLKMQFMQNLYRCTALALLSGTQFLCGQTQTAVSSAPAPTILKAGDLQADVAILRLAYEELHPGLYRYNTKNQMDAAFEALALQLNHDQSRQDAYLALSVFAAKIKCGHTYANFFNQPKVVVQELFLGQNRVPFYFDWLDGRMVVTQDSTPNHRLPRGTEVLEINGTSSNAILARLMTIARADGSNDAKRVASLGVNGDSIYETFDIFFPMFFPQPTTKMKLLVQEPGTTKPRAVEAEALTYEERIAPIKSREEGRRGGSDIVFDLRYLPDGSAHLRMPTWALYDSKWDWKGWLNARLDEIAEKKSSALIIDLRGNEGGLDVGNVILSRLVAKDLPLPTSRRLVRYRQIPQDLLPYLETWDPSFKDWGTSAVELPEPWLTAPPVNYLHLKKFDDNESGDTIKAGGKHYAGKIFVLVDANNSSATFQFAQTVQQNELGVLVGTPTGGNQRGISGGAFFFLQLPKSKIEMDLPLIGFFPPSEKPDAGLKPDIFAAPKVSDMVDGTDVSLAVVAKALHTH